MEEGEEGDVPQVVRRSTITTNLLFRLRKKKMYGYVSVQYKYI